jgi:hypothetical protein
MKTFKYTALLILIVSQSILVSWQRRESSSKEYTLTIREEIVNKAG